VTVGEANETMATRGRLVDETRLFRSEISSTADVSTINVRPRLRRLTTDHMADSFQSSRVIDSRGDYIHVIGSREARTTS
jgi:hypothetical protein